VIPSFPSGARLDAARHQTGKGFCMLTALILICSVTVTHDLQDCTRTNARVVMSVPTETANPVTCFMHAQAYVAETSLGQDLGADQVKIVCVQSATVVAAP
jgi:hypothetical protein